MPELQDNVDRVLKFIDDLEQLPMEEYEQRTQSLHHSKLHALKQVRLMLTTDLILDTDEYVRTC